MKIYYMITSLMMNFSMININGLSKIDESGTLILNIARRIGYWVCIIICLFDIIKKVLDGDTNGVWKTMFKYGIAFLSLFLFPWVLDLIKEIFA